MTEPRDPDGDDWGFPEVDPASTSLPPEEPDEMEEGGEGPFDTGSDAWWRAQAAAQRAAAAQEPPTPPAAPKPVPPVAPPPLVPPTVLQPEENPLDLGWVPPGLAPSGPPREAATPTPPPAPPVPPPAPLPPVAPPPPAPPAPSTPPPAAPVQPLTPPPPPVAPAAPPAAPRPPVPPPAAPPAPPAAPPAAPPVPPAAPVPPVPAVPPRGASPYPPLREELLEEEPKKVGPLQALLGALAAVAGVVLVIVAFLIFRGGDEGGTPTVLPPTQTASPTPSAQPSPTPSATSSPRPSATATTRPSATQAPAPVQAPVLPVTVLNNSRVKGLAATWARRLNAGGWPTHLVGNYSGGVVAETTVYYAPGQLASAKRLARQFGFDRVLPRFSGLPGSGLTLVLTRDAA